MLEMKITIEAPDLAASILKLAEAIASGPDPSILTPDVPMPVANYPTAPAAVPVTTTQTYTLDQISRAGASLVDTGKMQQLLELLSRYGVQAVTQLQPEQYGAFATELRGLGAQI